MNKVPINVFGQGGDLALVHGWGLGRAAWTPVVDRLAQHFRIHLIDLPGYENSPACPERLAQQGSAEGQSGDWPPEPFSGQPTRRTSTGAASRAAPSTREDFEACARALIARLPAGVTLCGWSLGGLLALQAALLAPGHIARLILVAATPSFTQRADWSAGQPAALLDTFQAAVADHPKATLQRFIALLNQGDPQARAIGRVLLSALTEQPLPSPETLNTGLNFLRDIDLRPQIAALQTPTLLIHGQRDTLMPLAAAQWLADYLPHARLEIFPDAAHAPFLNAPQYFTQLIADFCHVPAPD